MRLPFIPTLTGWHTDQPGLGGIHLQGHWLFLAKMLWIAIFVLTLVVFCANLVVGNYGLATTILLVATTSVWFAVSLVLFWRKSSDRFILLYSLVLLLTGGLFVPPLPFALWTYGVWWVPIFPDGPGRYYVELWVYVSRWSFCPRIHPLAGPGVDRRLTRTHSDLSYSLSRILVVVPALYPGAHRFLL
jgi:hypothetical protein